MFQWLNHGVVPSPDMVNREFAVFLQNEAVLRYQSFATVDLYAFSLANCDRTNTDHSSVQIS